jgi:hypothetical protein
MIGRSTRARLLPPLFLTLAAAYACGGNATNDADIPVANSSAGASSGGTSGGGGTAARVATNPPIASGGSGGAASGGGPANAAACPAAMPTAGSHCAPADDLGPEGCGYTGANGCTPIIATCASIGTWNVRLEPDYGDDTCDDDRESTCPDMLPAVDSVCDTTVGTECQYNPGAIVICSRCETWVSGDNGFNCGDSGAGGDAP